MSLSTYSAQPVSFVSSGLFVPSAFGAPKWVAGASHSGKHVCFKGLHMQHQSQQLQTGKTRRNCLLGGLGLFVTLFNMRAMAAVDDARVQYRKGIQDFVNGRVQQSVEAFDKAIELEPSYADILWQRGLSLYYCDRFEAAAKQFERDIRLNPRDTEEAIWRLISQARTGLGFSEAQKQIFPVEGETREYMRLIYDVCRGSVPLQVLEEKASSTAERATPNPGILQLFPQNGGYDRNQFYYNLYAGLIAEAQGRAAAAQMFLERAVNSPYSKEGDYMWFVASVHCKLRGWNT
eukprot:448544-Hanusia_phi.AAC.1